MNAVELRAAAERVVAERDRSIPSARKSGRNPSWPYVPIVLLDGRESQIRARAFATRAEAVQYASHHLVAQRELIVEQLLRPNFRALREHYGLPRELSISELSS